MALISNKFIYFPEKFSLNRSVYVKLWLVNEKYSIIIIFLA